jgi:hypothetical protein
MVTVKVIMNTSMEDILAFKCCSLPNQNLEIHIINASGKPVVVQNWFFLKNDTETIKVEYVYPPHFQTIQPNDICAFYCNMDETLWKKYHTLIMTDVAGNEYPTAI